jgi:hypothetical protein|tara:strand:- start:132 stop:977 length:846 start_codon:yes stop_codon:yes gene_type:complete
MAEQDLLKGNTLALEAIAEQLQKSNDLSAQLAARFAKEDEEKSDAENEEAEAIAKAAFTKEIVKAVGDAFGFAKGAEAPTGDSAAGMPVDDYNYKNVSSPATPPAADTQEDANIDNSTETTQQPLEAGEATSYSALQKENGMEEMGSDEYPQVEEEGDPEQMDMAYMKAQMGALAKAMTALTKAQTSTDSAVAEAVESQMRKIGWKEAEAGGRPVSRILPDVGDPLQKAAEIGQQVADGQFDPEAVVDQLTKMSYADMAEMQVSMAGEGDALSGILSQPSK